MYFIDKSKPEDKVKTESPAVDKAFENATENSNIKKKESKKHDNEESKKGDKSEREQQESQTKRYVRMSQFMDI